MWKNYKPIETYILRRLPVTLKLRIRVYKLKTI